MFIKKISNFVVNVCASNLGIGRFVIDSHFVHQNDPDYGLTIFPHNMHEI